MPVQQSVQVQPAAADTAQQRHLKTARLWEIPAAETCDACSQQSGGPGLAGKGLTGETPLVASEGRLNNSNTI